MWSTLVQNNTCNGFFRFSEHRGLMERISQKKTTINDSQPLCPSFLLNKEKKTNFDRETQLVIDYNNFALFKNMHQYLNKPSPYSECNNKHMRCPAFEKDSINYSKIRQIIRENKKLKIRYQSAKPIYITKKIISHYNYNKDLNRRIYRPINNPNLNFATWDKVRKNLSTNIKKLKITGKSSNGNLNKLKPSFSSGRNNYCIRSRNNNFGSNDEDTDNQYRKRKTHCFVDKEFIREMNNSPSVNTRYKLKNSFESKDAGEINPYFCSFLTCSAKNKIIFKKEFNGYECNDIKI